MWDVGEGATNCRANRTFEIENDEMAVEQPALALADLILSKEQMNAMNE